ncbi:EAL domain-containing protein [Paucibacter sediminis]|uniref:EAL domain-containing protein n=1 Tax=Paucibacter sediminis TaxID=3019553 RepID=A0AA95SYV0_9BURK|nr:EAL domain-containing protein [Paucibacter sp. S2-9]WIT13939.1 EAL domain-containing protein [Paucibacter sp. S2-9]
MDLYRFLFVEHDPQVVLVSLLIAIGCWWTVFVMGSHVAAGEASGDDALARRWHIGRSLVLGCGIWAFHFLGMLGWQPGPPLSFDRAQTFASLLLSVLGASPLLSALRRARRPASALDATRLLGFALALGGMHYTGILAADTTPGPNWHAGLVLLSVLLALGLGIAARGLKRWLLAAPSGQGLRRRAQAAVALGLLLGLVHYVGVAAADFLPGTICRTEGTLSGRELTALVALFIVSILAAALWLSINDARTASRLQQQNHALQTRAQLLEQLVHLDAATGLPNRAALESALAAMVEAEQSEAALLLIEMSGYQTVCDSWGHELAHELLRQAKQRIELQMPDGATLFRSSDQQFALLLRHAGEDEALAPWTEQLCQALLQPYELDGRSVSLACHLGRARTDSTGELLQLVPMARTACDFARRAGADWLAFEPHMFSDAREELELQGALRRAIERRELSLVYQPKVDACSGRLRGVEALLRWRRADQGWISPASFIPVAERYGLMGSIGLWVLREAIDQQARWLAMGLNLQMSINLSPQQLEQADLVDSIAELLRQHGVAPRWLCLEITESAAMLRPQHTQAQLLRLRELGLDLSIDDFGTGHSSLSYLHRLPVTELKIDRSFVLALQTGSLPIVKATLQMAHSLGLRTVAEGVETEQQRECLVACGVEQLQGFLIARPMPAQDLLAALDPSRLAFRPSRPAGLSMAMAGPR